MCIIYSDLTNNERCEKLPRVLNLASNHLESYLATILATEISADIGHTLSNMFVISLSLMLEEKVRFSESRILHHYHIPYFFCVTAELCHVHTGMHNMLFIVLSTESQ